MATINITRNLILEELLPGEDLELLTDATQLVSSGILDSLATLRLADFPLEQSGIELEPREMSLEHMDTLSDLFTW